MNRLRKILETKTAGIVCSLFAIANRMIFASLHSLVGTDTKVQLTYAQNLMAGKGMGVTKYFTNDLTTPIYDSHLLFPPGFSLAIIPFLSLSGNDEFKAVHVFDIVTSVVFIFAVRHLSKRSGLPDALTNIVTLIAGCSQFVFFMSWSSTDGISLCFVLFAMAATLNIIDKGKEIGLLKAIGCSLLFCMPYFFRYMYLPVAVLLPLLILLSGISLKNKKLKVAGGKLLGLATFFLAILFAFSLFISSNALHLNDFGRGFYFNQLTNWYPFLPASFINLDFAAQLIEKILPWTYTQAMFLFNIINLVLFILGLSLLGRYIYFYNKNLFSSNHSSFITVGSFTSISIILLLVYLSFTYKEIEWGYIKWTYISDERYYAFLYIFVPILFFICVHHFKPFFKRSFFRLFVFLTLCIFCLEIMHGIYYNIKILLHQKDLANIREAENGYKNFPSIIKKIEEKYPDRQVFISSPDFYYMHDASQRGYKVIFDYQNLSQTVLRAPAQSILILPIHTNELIIMKDYLEKKKPKSISTSDGTFFYIEEINPE